MRSGTGTYLRSCRSISRKPVILPIKPDAPESLIRLYCFPPSAPHSRGAERRSYARTDGLYLILQQRPLGRVSKNEASSWPYGFETAQAPPLHEDNQLRPDRDFRFGIGVGLQFLQCAAV